MILPDVNVLIYAFRQESVDHDRYREWLLGVVNGAESYGLSEFVCSSFLRIVTNRRAFEPPASIEDSLVFLNGLRDREHCVLVSPGPRHWAIFTELVRSVGATGNSVPDAYFAALAIDSGSEWVTTDRGFARFPGLHWGHPLR